uniref:Potassium channel domain-containing protein n=1 Tax=Meloidogyne floridensis TaxID=298350 RepID=A0A915NWS3_9BILA
MTAIQRISANIAKQRKDSLFSRFGNLQLPLPSNELELNEVADTDECGALLSEAKEFIDKIDKKEDNVANKDVILNEDVKMLRFLCEMLEKSVHAENAEKEKIVQNKEDKEQKTWAAGFGQKQKRRNIMLESMTQQTIVGIDNMGIIPEEQEQQMGNIDKCEKEGKEKESSQYYTNVEEIEGGVLYEETEPLYIHFIPHLAMIASLIAYMIIGSLIYRVIDHEIGKKSWARSFIWVFQLLATIGWGDSQAGNTQSQAFTVIYIIIGIPMLFSVYANLGRLVTHFCCQYWPIIISKIFGKEHNKDEDFDVLKTQRLPLSSILALLIFHQCVGITTMATSGFGDYHPDTDSWPETIIAVLYISIGIVLLSALFLTLALYYQTFLYIEFKGIFVQLYDKLLLWKRCNKVGDNGIVEKGVAKNLH